MMRWLTYLHRSNDSVWMRRLTRAPGYYSRGLYQQIAQKDIFLWAQAIAFKVLITIVPVIILATGVLAIRLSREEALASVFDYVAEFLPAYQTEQLLGFLTNLSQAATEFTIVGIAGVLFSAVILFTTLRVAVGNVFQEDWHEGRSIVGGYIFDLRMVGQVGLFFLLTFGLTLAMQTLNQSGFEFIERIGLDYVWVREGWRRAFKTLLGVVLPFMLTTAMFFQLIYFIPKPHPPKRSAFLGALTTSILWEAAKYGFALYATNIGRFDFSDDGGSGIGEVFGLIIAFVFWVYYSGIVLLVGAIVALLHEKGHRSRRQAALAEAEGKPAGGKLAEDKPAEELPAPAALEAPEADLLVTPGEEPSQAAQAAPSDAVPGDAAPDAAAPEPSWHAADAPAAPAAPDAAPPAPDESHADATDDVAPPAKAREDVSVN